MSDCGELSVPLFDALIG